MGGDLSFTDVGSILVRRTPLTFTRVSKNLFADHGIGPIGCFFGCANR